MSYYHLTINERKSILEFKANGDSIRKIALKLRRSPSTISRELKRCNKHCSPSTAHKNYLNKRRNCHKPRLLDQNLILCDRIVALIQEKHWSPEQISNRLKKENLPTVSYNTIYRHLNNHNLNQPLSSRGDKGFIRSLRHRGRKRSHNKERKH
ncbi:helix-turn-helix domain-containing protein [Latilactobacillus fuchuensis]|uniref:helix-turn-helix domain-containing protein n=1 Tax=Latilactobacillus fuchuensis TaxID=164393 RepID=UPI001E3B5BC5|nr:helix-turn-helix domain-containing protein [Latilactobacillus fuchuensis]